MVFSKLVLKLEGGDWVSQLSMYLLGPPRVERDGVPIQVDTRKAIALLTYLAVTAESHRRASLVNLLWPESDRARGRAALRRTLYALRKALADDWLDVDREEIGLRLGSAIWMDVDQFRRHLAECQTHGHPATEVCPACAASLTEAVVLYRGDFLSGFGLRDSFNFDEWQFFQAEALRRELAGALGRLVHWHSSQREFDTAVGYARRWLALDPLDEQGHRELMRLYAWSGQRSAALAQYEECVQILQDQLGVPPQEHTTELYEAIKEGRAPPAPPPYGPPDLPVRPPFLLEQEPVERPVFVARERELAQLDWFLDGALAGRGKVVFVTGEAGCGKTALIQEFARRAQTADAALVVAWGHGNAHTGVGDPYLPFREVLGLLTGDVEAWWAARVMTTEQARRLWHVLPLTVQALVKVGPDLVDLFVPGGALVERARAFTSRPVGSVWQTQLEGLVARGGTLPGGPSLQQSALFEQYTQVLRTLASRRPLLLALDDLQWADGGSINLLFHLGRQIAGSRILVVGAYRPADVALGRPASPLPAGGIEGGRERHPLEPVVNEFKRYFGAIEVNLEPAEGREARGRRFVDAFLDSEPNRLKDAFRESLYQHTGGYPLFTVELLRGMRERGDLVRDAEGRWVEGPSLHWQRLPGRLEAAIAERIGRLPVRLRDALAVASVEGETFTAEVVARVRAADEEEMVRRLSDSLDRRHRLVSARGVLRIGDQCLSQYRFRHILFQRYLYDSLDLVERVHLHQAVGTALETLYEEGAGAVEGVALQLARHFEAAGIAEKAGAYLYEAGERARRLYANQEAVDHFRRALALLQDAPPDRPGRGRRREMTAQIGESLGDVLEWTGAHDEAQAAYRGALADVPAGDGIWQARLHRKSGNIARLQRRYDQALEAYDLAQTTLGPAPAESPAAWWHEWVQILLERMWLHYWLGEWREISQLAHQVRPTVEQRGTASQCVNFLLSLATMYTRRDRYVVSQETLEFCQTALAISLESDNLSEIAWARFVLGFNQLWTGDLDGASRQMQTALALAERTGDVVHQSRCLTYLTILYRKRGQLDQVRQYASRGLELANAAEMLEYVGTAQANLAWLAWREGDLTQAEAKGRAALATWRQLPAAHASCAFRWTAFWPLIGVALAHHQTSEATEHARALLEPTQQRLPEALTAVLEEALTAWEESKSDAACACFDQAIVLAQEFGYL
jgi:DNA-binding SARP family transcriptional activator